MLGVKNNSKDAIEARYDGVDYVFEPGVNTAISTEAASHIFGFGLEDKSRALIRLGWLANSTQYAEAVKRLNDIQFSEAKVTFDEPIQSGTLMNAPPGKGTLTLPKAEAAGKK